MSSSHAELAEPVTIFSDMHIAHPASLVREPAQVRGLLPSSGTVIFNGDTVEMRSEQDREEGRANRDLLVTMCREAGCEPIFLTGNHDLLVSERHYVEMYGGKVLITHGDILFHGVSPWSHESHMIAEEHTRLLESLAPHEMGDFEVRMATVKKASRVLEKFYVARRSLVSVAKNILLEFMPPWRPASVLWYWHKAPGRAVEVLEQFKPDARFMLIGHMHRAGIWLRDGKVIINTGCFFPFVGRYFLRIEAAQIHVTHIRRGPGGFIPGNVHRTFQIVP